MKILEFALLSLMPEETTLLSPVSLQILLTVWSWFSSDYVVLSGLYHSLSYTSLFSLPWVLVHAILRLFLPFCPCALFVCLFCLFLSVFLLSTESYLLGKWAKLKTGLSDSPKSIFSLYWRIPLVSSHNSGSDQMRQLQPYTYSPAQL